jgi:hypothetical protein
VFSGQAVTPANLPDEDMVELAKPSNCGEQAQHISNRMKRHFTSFCEGSRRCCWRKPWTVWSRFQRYIARRRHCGCRPEARLKYALNTFERDPRQHCKQVARQCNGKLLLLSGSAVLAIVLVMQ